MKRYAEVVNGLIVCTNAVCEDDHDLACAPPVVRVVITGGTGEPEVGGLWDGEKFLPKPGPTPDEIAIRVRLNVMQLPQAAQSYIDAALSAKAARKLQVGVLAGTPLALLVDAWVDSVWDLCRQNELLVTHEYNPALYDFSSLGAMPCTSADLLVELVAIPKSKIKNQDDLITELQTENVNMKVKLTKHPGYFISGALPKPQTLRNSSKSNRAVSGIPWMSGSAFTATGPENCCPATTPLSTAWDTDIAQFPVNNNLELGLKEWGPRLTCWPRNTYDLFSEAAFTSAQVVADGLARLTIASGGKMIVFDAENYDTSPNKFLFFHKEEHPNYATHTDAEWQDRMRLFGRTVGTAIWAVDPSIELFGFMLWAWYGFRQTGAVAVVCKAEMTYADWSPSSYNLLPFFTLGLLDVCPSTGIISEGAETISYGQPGPRAMARVHNMIKRAPALFSGGEQSIVKKAAKVYKSRLGLYPNCYLVDKSAPYYAGAGFINSTNLPASYIEDQRQQLAYVALAALYNSDLPPWLYLCNLENDPWAQLTASNNIPTFPAEAESIALRDALRAYQLDTPLPFDLNLLRTHLVSAFTSASRPDYALEAL